ncbi:YdeI/OmpD-associated family protein [Actinomyces sp. ZJ308]|uniref:YdeI/OmpD-associated family protein n=1 Tax=Actinomyces sp. ZJ308 TaxID=2708342 RepID=UPI00141E95F4|nr:YdeI/OmpD-associated family protein [Actinomyces sp. ZJ308]
MSNDQAGIPVELTEALSENETAEKIFATLPPSHQNEYLRWICEAKRAETRRRRAVKAVEMMVDKHG